MGDLLYTLALRRFASGTLGPVTFGLNLRDSCLVILFFNLFSAIPPAYL
jgi:purine-cytosine permease-like protein